MDVPAFPRPPASSTLPHTLQRPTYPSPLGRPPAIRQYPYPDNASLRPRPKSSHSRIPSPLSSSTSDHEPPSPILPPEPILDENDASLESPTTLSRPKSIRLRLYSAVSSKSQPNSLPASTTSPLPPRPKTAESLPKLPPKSAAVGKPKLARTVSVSTSRDPALNWLSAPPTTTPLFSRHQLHNAVMPLKPDQVQSRRKSQGLEIPIKPEPPHTIRSRNLSRSARRRTSSSITSIQESRFEDFDDISSDFKGAVVPSVTVEMVEPVTVHASALSNDDFGLLSLSSSTFTSMSSRSSSSSSHSPSRTPATSVHSEDEEDETVDSRKFAVAAETRDSHVTDPDDVVPSSSVSRPTQSPYLQARGTEAQEERHVLHDSSQVGPISRTMTGHSSKPRYDRKLSLPAKTSKGGFIPRMSTFFSRSLPDVSEIGQMKSASPSSPPAATDSKRTALSQSGSLPIPTPLSKTDKGKKNWRRWFAH